MKILFKIIFNILIIIGINFSAYAFSTDWKISSDGVNDIIKMRISSATEGVVGLYNIPISLEIVTSLVGKYIGETLVTLACRQK